MTHGVAATAGHRSDQMGLRGHSVGDVFPFIIFYKGTFDDLYLWVKQPNGLEIGPFKEYSKAHSLAARLKMFGQLSIDDPATPDIIKRETEQQYTYYRAKEDDLHSRWRWRVKPDAARNSKVEASNDHGETWFNSTHWAWELRTKQEFVSIGDKPQWQM